MEEKAGSWTEIAEYRRVIQVREPYERLLSAYRFTFQNKNGLRDNMQLNKKLLQAYPHLPHEQVESRDLRIIETYIRDEMMFTGRERGLCLVRSVPPVDSDGSG